jgi:Family of unknown function (DUF6510)
MKHATYTDGNALAGPLAELFAIDVTVGATTCAECGRRSHVAELRVYAAGPGSVARCPGCEAPVMRYVRTPTTAILDLRGTVSLSVPVPPHAT